MEIERKWVVSKEVADTFIWLSHIQRNKGESIQQGYLNGNVGIRLRSQGQYMSLTVKGDGTLAREEWEVPIPSWVFSKLWGKTAKRRVSKTRYMLEYKKHQMVLDVYHGKLRGLRTIEVEFKSIASAKKFELPYACNSVTKEVTEDKRYTNYSLSMHGLPRSFRKIR